jgi:zinc protease
MAVELAPPRSDADSIAFEAVNTVLGGSFISRLNMNLREDKHWSYGASSTLIDAKGQRPFVVSAMVQTDKTAPSMSEAAKELRELVGARHPSETEIHFAKDALVLTLPGSNETAGEVARSYTDILTYGLPDTYWNELVGKVGSLTPTQLDAAASRLVHPDAFTWLIVGDLAKIEPAVRQLGFGEVQVLDADGHVLR